MFLFVTVHESAVGSESYARAKRHLANCSAPWAYLIDQGHSRDISSSGFFCRLSDCRSSPNLPAQGGIVYETR
jgi:hypothetical protein